MRRARIIMGMPVLVEIVSSSSSLKIKSAEEAVFKLFNAADDRFSTYLPDSEINQINDGLPKSRWSDEMKAVLKLCEVTRLQSDGYFDIKHNGKLDPSGLVKGWAINKAADLLRQSGFYNFYLEAGGDIQVSGHNPLNQPWRLGIKNPFNIHEIVKVIDVTDKGVATSGTYTRGMHIYNPLTGKKASDNIKSLTVIGPDIYEADRFATAAFAMGQEALDFIESRPGLEGYMITSDGRAAWTTNFEKFVVHAAG